MTEFDREMMAALEADGEYLRQMTGQDHGPYFFDAPGCIECGAALPSPSDAVCETCLQTARDAAESNRRAEMEEAQHQEEMRQLEEQAMEEHFRRHPHG
jgi:hypothetical protein